MRDDAIPDDEELARLGLYDPSAPDATDRLELVRYVLGQGAGADEVAASTNLSELALDRNIRVPGVRTMGEVAEECGLSWEAAARLLEAVGLIPVRAQLATAEEAATLALLAGAQENLLGEEATIQLARVTGQAMARVAETLVGVFRLRMELPRRDAGTSYVDVVKEYAELAQTLLPVFVGTLDAVLRRQIVAVADRMWFADDDRSAVLLPRTVGFVDLVGYTAATSRLSVRELTRVLMDFDTRTADVVARGNGQVVKTIGDEAMFVTEDAADACRIALDLVEAGGGQLPAVRVGLARGFMVSVLGDIYGPDVNLAARLVAEADVGGALVSAAVSEAAGGDGFALEPVAALTLKGYAEPVPAFRLRR